MRIHHSFRMAGCLYIAVFRCLRFTLSFVLFHGNLMDERQDNAKGSRLLYSDYPWP